MDCPGLNIGSLVQKDDLITCMCKKKGKKRKKYYPGLNLRYFVLKDSRSGQHADGQAGRQTALRISS